MLSLGALVVATVAGQVPSPENAVRLLYVREVGTQGCPVESELRAAVAARLGYDPFRAEASRSVVARIVAVDGALTGSIELVDEAGLSRGKRELHTADPSCQEMARAMALSISIAVDPERAAGAVTEPASRAEMPTEEAAPTPSEPARQAATEPAPVRGEPAPPLAGAQDVVPKVTTPVRARLSLAFSALSMAGVAPGLAFGGGVEAQVRRGAWALGVGGRLLRSPSSSVDRATALELTLAAAELNGCVRHAVFEHCLLGLAGVSWLKPDGVLEPRSPSGAFGALGLRSGFMANLSRRLSLFTQLEGLAVLSPVHAQVDEADVWAAPSVAGTIAVGARTHFW